MSAFQEFVTRKLAEHDERFDRVDERFDRVDERLGHLGGEVARLGVLMEDRDRKIDVILEVCLGMQSVSDSVKGLDRRLDGHEVRLRALEAASRARTSKEEGSK